MTPDQLFVFGVLLLVLILFIVGRWRYDIVALLALLIITVVGIVPASEAFTGFGHPAVVTVAAVLVVSRGLQNSGVIEVIAQLIGKVGNHPLLHLAALTGLVAICSAFMNNVGALALFMPVAVQIARQNELSPSRFLMPLAFASLLGGMTTLIGTPPNIIVATFRTETGAPPFGMFDFTLVGAGVAIAGLLFIVLLGWRLIPHRKGQAAREDLFQIEDYLTEVWVPDKSKAVGKRLYDLNAQAENDIRVVGLVRDKQRLPAPSPMMAIRGDDILIVRADSENLKALVDRAGLELVGSEALGQADLKSDEVNLIEAVVAPNSLMIGETAVTLDLRRRYGVNLIAIARQGAQLRLRLDRVHFRLGDVLLLQGPVDTLPEVLVTLGCLPLAGRELRIGRPRRIVLVTALFAAALVLTALGRLPVQVAFTGAAVMLVMAKFLSLREAYASIDWSIIILLGAMIPVGQALETTGGAQTIAAALLKLGRQLPPSVMLAAVLIGTMFLSDVVNNAAAAILMAPVAISVAHGLDASADPFLMSVAIGSSCAFLTPIGHQSNTLVMGPGGYHFGDYWRMGLPLEVIVAAVAIPLILLVWPL